jgi:hypothetical protein
MWMMRGDMAHDNCGKVIPGTDVAHYFGPSPKVGQRGHYYVGVSMRDFDSGSPGWDRTFQSMGDCSDPGWVRRFALEMQNRGFRP